ANVIVIAALLGEGVFGLAYVDRIGSGLVAAYMTYAGWDLLRMNLDILVDRDISERYFATIHSFVESRDDVRAYHDLRSRATGDTRFLEVHLDLNQELSFAESHRLCEDLVLLLKEADPNVHATIHADPVERTASGELRSIEAHDKRGRFR